MQLRPLASDPLCTGIHDCAGVHATDHGTLAVQGRLIQPGELPAGVAIPVGEALVEIPTGILLAAARQLDEAGVAS